MISTIFSKKYVWITSGVLAGLLGACGFYFIDSIVGEVILLPGRMLQMMGILFLPKSIIENHLEGDLFRGMFVISQIISLFIAARIFVEIISRFIQKRRTLDNNRQMNLKQKSLRKKYIWISSIVVGSIPLIGLIVQANAFDYLVLNQALEQPNGIIASMQAVMLNGVDYFFSKVIEYKLRGFGEGIIAFLPIIMLVEGVVSLFFWVVISRLFFEIIFKISNKYIRYTFFAGVVLFFLVVSFWNYFEYKGLNGCISKEINLVRREKERCVKRAVDENISKISKYSKKAQQRCDKLQNEVIKKCLLSVNGNVECLNSAWRSFTSNEKCWKKKDWKIVEKNKNLKLIEYSSGSEHLRNLFCNKIVTVSNNVKKTSSIDKKECKKMLEIKYKKFNNDTTDKRVDIFHSMGVNTLSDTQINDFKVPQNIKKEMYKPYFGDDKYVVGVNTVTSPLESENYKKLSYYIKINHLERNDYLEIMYRDKDRQDRVRVETLKDFYNIENINVFTKFNRLENKVAFLFVIDQTEVLMIAHGVDYNTVEEKKKIINTKIIPEMIKQLKQKND
jgi:hypothetical protein